MKDLIKYKKVIEDGIREYVKKANAKGLVVGLSGGIDSTLVAYLSVNAIGAEKVYGMMLPTDDTDISHIKDASLVAKNLEIEFDIENISERIASFFNYDETDKRVTGNVASRVRMITLYREANRRNYLVAGTSNKSEMMIGYFTKYGDGGIDFEPIGDLFKTEVFEMAKLVGVPERIIKKKPTAGLWKGQTDEAELGIKYENLDRILELVEKNYNAREITERYTEATVKDIEKVLEKIELNRHKGVMPPVITVHDSSVH